MTLLAITMRATDNLSQRSSRIASFRGHLKGTKNWIHISNRLASLKHEKRRTKKIVAENKLYDILKV